MTSYAEQFTDRIIEAANALADSPRIGKIVPEQKLEHLRQRIIAVAAGAKLIVSGDSDLLALHPFHGVQILAPTAAAKVIAV